jgi:hypothetical protein
MAWTTTLNTFLVSYVSPLRGLALPRELLPTASAVGYDLSSLMGLAATHQTLAVFALERSAQPSKAEGPGTYMFNPKVEPPTIAIPFGFGRPRVLQTLLAILVFRAVAGALGFDHSFVVV